MTPSAGPDLEGRVVAAAEGRGRLFLQGVPGCDARALYAAPYPDGDALERAWSTAIDRRIATARELGAALLFLTPPDAHGVHQEDLPEGWTFATPTVGDVFDERFGARIDIIHSREALREADGAIPVWRRTDSHWSAWGAYVAYRLVMDRLPERLRRRVVQADEFELGWRADLGDLGALSRDARPVLAPWVQLNAPRAHCVADRSSHRRDAYKVFEVADPSLPTCVVFRDSFATDLAPYLVESFRRTVLVAAGARSFPELIHEERPDVILVERAERTLPLGVYDWAPTTWREHWPAPSCGPGEAVAASAERDAGRALDAGDPDAAIAAAVRATAASPTPDRRFLLGRAHLLTGDADEAAAAFEAALAEAPDRFAFLLHLGIARLRQDRPTEARDLFARACALHPWHPVGYEHLGYACLTLGEPAAALAALERAVRLGPEIVGAWMWLSQAHEALGRPDLARRAVEAGLAACPGEPALVARLDALGGGSPTGVPISSVIPEAAQPLSGTQDRTEELRSPGCRLSGSLTRTCGRDDRHRYG